MKRVIVFVFFSFLCVTFSNAQCAIDYTYSPTGVNYGLHPDTLPSGVVGQPYSQDMTFFLPLDTTIGGVFVTFEDFHITSISLPLGLTWECNNSTSSCHYDPLVSQYGCVNASGVCLIAGVYDVEVNLVATHSFSSLVGTENISFTLPFTIFPDTSTSSNVGFAMTSPAGCAPITISFSNNNTGMLSYSWDFGNGNNSSLAQPVDQIYSQPGEYIVQYSAVQSNPIYFLESITVNSGLCWDAVAGDPDFFYTVSTPSGILEEVDISNYITQPFPLTINSFNPLLLSGQSVTIDLYDDDSGLWTTIEDCGTLVFTPVQQAGNWSASNSELAINYTVMEVPANVVTALDTIVVYGYPNAANLIYDTLNTILYTDSGGYAMQWYYYDSPIPGATDTFFNPLSSGLYSLVIVNEFGCATISENILAVVCDTSYQPILSVDNMVVMMADSALFNDVQWYDDNGLIVGAIHPILEVPESGFYTISATDTFGCSYFSEEILVCNNDVQVDLVLNDMVISIANSSDFSTFEWMQDGTLIASDTPFLDITESNYYSVIVQNEFGCEYSSVNILVCNVLFSPEILIDNDAYILSVDAADMSVQWFMDGEVLEDETSSILQVIQDGNYTVVLTDEFGCAYNNSESIVMCSTVFSPEIFVDSSSHVLNVDTADMSVQWFMNGEILENETNSTFQITQNGYYTVVLTDEFGCDYESEGYLYSIENPSYSGLVRVYPNPVATEITIEIDIEDFSDVTLELVDVLGRRVVQRTVKASEFPYQLDAKNFLHGLYYLDIIFDENKISKKLIKLEVD